MLPDNRSHGKYGLVIAMSNKLLQILFLQQLKGIGPAKINSKYNKALRMSSDINEIADQVSDSNTYSQIPLAKENAMRLMDSILSDETIKAITVLDAEYPEALKALGDKRPVVIYAQGNADLLSKTSVSVVGTRKPSDQTIRATLSMAERISKRGILVVSGLAEGTDTHAHMGALKEQGGTIAMLPSGFNRIYPKQNTGLATKIVASGCLVSEYTPDAASNKFTFVRRDSLIAALSRGTIIMECGVKSGTMHTANAAFEMHRLLGCYLPENRGESFAGNELIINSLKGIEIIKHSDLEGFCDRL